MSNLLNLGFIKKLELIRQHEYLDIFINDPDWSVRLEVAKQGYGLDKLVNDKKTGVLIEVAKQGYGLEKLINDTRIKGAVLHYCKNNIEKEECRKILNLYNL